MTLPILREQVDHAFDRFNRDLGFRAPEMIPFHVGVLQQEIGCYFDEADDPDVNPKAEEVAKAFHEAYEELAPHHGYETREASAKPWEKVPDNNRALMVATVARLMGDGVIR